MKTYKSATHTIDSHRKQVGDGFDIRSPLPHQAVKQIGPFLLLDHAGPTHIAPSHQSKGVDEHPHRGFETVTVVYDGFIEHRDSAGHSGRIGPGDVQWMTAGAGVVHEEKHGKEFSAQGGTLEMIQLWVNLPRQYKMTQPRYQEITAAQIPVMAHEGGKIRVIAGTYGNVKGPAQTFTPITLLDVRVNAQATTEILLPNGFDAGLYVVHGKVQVNDSHTASESQLVVFAPDSKRILIEAQADSTLLLLAGQPIDEPVASYGPFVMNNTQELMQAVQDYQNGKMGKLRPKII